MFIINQGLAFEIYEFIKITHLILQKYSRRNYLHNIIRLIKMGGNFLMLFYEVFPF